ncbi:MAG: tetratricopeptide repeat protein, partial [Planctomycetota bacterium]
SAVDGRVTVTLVFQHIFNAPYIPFVSPGRLADSLPILEDALNVARERTTTRFRLHRELTYLANTYYVSGQLEDGLRLFEEALPLCRKDYGPTHFNTVWLMGRIQATLLRLEHFSEAVDLGKQLVGMAEESLVPNESQLAEFRVAYAESLVRLNRNDEALEQLDRATASTKITQINRLRADNLRAGILVSRGELEKGELLLVSSTDVMIDNLPEVHIAYQWYVPAAIERVVSTFTAQHKLDQVATWKAKLADTKMRIEQLQNGNMQTNQKE